MCIQKLSVRLTAWWIMIVWLGALPMITPLAAQTGRPALPCFADRPTLRSLWKPLRPSFDSPYNADLADNSVGLLKRLPPLSSETYDSGDPVIQRVSYAEEATPQGGSDELDSESGAVYEELLESPTKQVFEEPARVDENVPLPIDLANALAMGGGSHLEIQLARQRLVEAQADLTEARALWLPSFRFGVGWTKHDGRLQETQGNIVEVSRNALFFGGGAGLGGSPLAGGAGGPARLFVNLSLSDAIFEQRTASWSLQAACAEQDSTRNRVLRDIAVAYFDLLEVHGMLANAQVGYDAAVELRDLTKTLADQGEGTQAAVERATTEVKFWMQRVEDTQRMTVSRSANLNRLLRLNPHSTLVPVESKVVPLDLIDPKTPVEALTAEALTNRPELDQLQALIHAASFRTRQEHLRPWLPHLQAGASGGTFGGGVGSSIENDGSRSDLDLLAVWELKNAGVGNHAAYRRRRAQLEQARLQMEWVRDQVTAEIVSNSADVSSFHRQMDIALDRVAVAGKSYHKNRDRIVEGEGLPIELVQVIRARVEALDAYTQTVVSYNRSQYRLLQSLGRSAS